MAKPDVEIDYKHDRKRTPDPIDELTKAIGKAEKRIDAVVYKISPPRIFDALKEATKGGKVKVRILVNDGLPKKLRRKMYHYQSVGKGSKEPRQLTKAHWPDRPLAKLAMIDRVEVRQWTQSKLHVKLLIVDDRFALSGSYNWSDSAGGENAELLLKFNQKAQVRQFSEVFMGLWDQEDVAKPLFRM